MVNPSTASLPVELRFRPILQILEPLDDAIRMWNGMQQHAVVPIRGDSPSLVVIHEDNGMGWRGWFRVRSDAVDFHAHFFVGDDKNSCSESGGWFQGGCRLGQGFDIVKRLGIYLEDLASPLLNYRPQVLLQGRPEGLRTAKRVRLGDDSCDVGAADPADIGDI